jgi:hypothetical protein
MNLMKPILAIFLTLFMFWASAQTKMIAHKSHSGSDAHFKLAITQHLFDVDASNFGVVPMSAMNFEKLDSVIFVNDTSVILVISSMYDDSDAKTKVGGRKMRYRDPLLSKRHALDSIKNILNEGSYLLYNTENVKLIGYDNQKSFIPRKKEESVALPIGIESQRQPPANYPLAEIVLFVAAVSLAAGFVNARRHRLRSRTALHS